jgi:hypothetical protein
MKKALMAAVIAAIGLSAPAGAGEVQNWESPMHYPARLIAVRWENGRLDARTSMKFGAWTISFGPPLHFVLYYRLGDGHRGLSLGGDNADAHGSAAPARKLFHCSNAAVGGRFCSLHFKLNNREAECELLIYYTKTYLADDYIDIPCPTSLELAQ